MNYMEILYETWSDHATNSEEFISAVEMLCADDKTDAEQHDKDYDILTNCLIKETRIAFEAGFDCAVQLLKTGRNPVEEPEITNSEDFPNEEWRNIQFSEHYSVSNYGRVRNDNSKHILTPRKNSDGYLSVKFYHLGHCQQWLVHRLVAFAFLPQHNQNEIFVNHLDGNKQNNHVANLEWTDKSGNMIHAYRTGLNKGSAQPILIFDKEGVLIRRFSSKTRLLQAMHMCKKTLKKYLSGEKKHPEGYVFIPEKENT